MVKIISLHIITVFILFPNFLFSQHYDIGYPENYIAIHEFIDDSNQTKEITYIINDHKKVTKVFNSDGRIIEDLVFIDGELTSGTEYFTYLQFQFLETPRTFEMQNIERSVINYENIKLSSSLIQYMPKSKKAIFRVRVYQNNKSEFYILKLNGSEELYYK
tara:strand:- start:1297 stop:1779 length:483 start_codon:yes stop_codon:yes gene_type:complete